MRSNPKPKNRPVCRMRLDLVSQVLIAALTLLGTTGTATAQFGHSDVDFGLEGNTLITDKRVYESFFPTFGISKQFSSNPGFASESDGIGTVRSGDEIVYDVLDDLVFWDGTQFATPGDGVSIRIDNNPPGSSSTFVSGTSGEQLGSLTPPVNRIGAASGRGEVHSHVNYFLESEEDDPQEGAYGLKIVLSTDRNGILDSDPIFLVFNYGLDAATFEESLPLYEELLDALGIAGDFNESGALDVGDIDLLTDAVQSNSADLRFDVDGNGSVDPDDRRAWVEELRATYFGDANLDGEFSSTDLVSVFQLGEYEDEVASNSTWSEGDWTGDLEFGSADFVLAFQAGGYEQGPRASVAVPEPSAMSLVLLSALVWLSTRSE